MYSSTRTDSLCAHAVVPVNAASVSRLKPSKHTPSKRAKPTWFLVFISVFLLLFYKELFDPVNPHAHELFDAQILESTCLHAADILRRHSVNPHSDQLIRIGVVVSQLLQLRDEFR